MKRLVEKLLVDLNSEKQKDSLVVLRGKKLDVDMDISKFKPINTVKNSDFCAVFIDGGYASIIESATFSLSAVRIASVYMKGTKIIRRCVENFVVLAQIKSGFVELNTFPEEYKQKFVNLNLKEEDLLQKAVKADGLSESEINRSVGILMRLRELQVSLDAQKHADFVFLDGSLELETEQEKKLFSELKNSKIVGVSKTTKIKTFSGTPIGFALTFSNQENIKNKWCFKLPCSEPDCYVVKLNEASRTVKLDTYKPDKLFLGQALSVLELNASDPVMPGYPYGLIEADQDARISTQEKKGYFAELIFIAGKEFEKIEAVMQSSNAHQILDSINF